MFLFKPMVVNEKYYLSQAIEELQETDFEFYQELQELYTSNLIELCVTLHQSDYKTFEMVSLDKVAMSPQIVKLLVKMTKKLVLLSDIGGFEMHSTKEFFEFPNGTRITDFIIRKKGD
jgi:hypothetical protein